MQITFFYVIENYFQCFTVFTHLSFPQLHVVVNTRVYLHFTGGEAEAWSIPTLYCLKSSFTRLIFLANYLWKNNLMPWFLFSKASVAFVIFCVLLTILLLQIFYSYSSSTFTGAVWTTWFFLCCCCWFVVVPTIQWIPILFVTCVAWLNII